METNEIFFIKVQEGEHFESVAEARERDTEEKIAHNKKLQLEMERARKEILEANVNMI